MIPRRPPVIRIGSPGRIDHGLARRRRQAGLDRPERDPPALAVADLGAAVVGEELGREPVGRGPRGASRGSKSTTRARTPSHSRASVLTSPAIAPWPAKKSSGASRQAGERAPHRRSPRRGPPRPPRGPREVVRARPGEQEEAADLRPDPLGPDRRDRAPPSAASRSGKRVDDPDQPALAHAPRRRPGSTESGEVRSTPARVRDRRSRPGRTCGRAGRVRNPCSRSRAAVAVGDPAAVVGDQDQAAGGERPRRSGSEAARRRLRGPSAGPATLERDLGGRGDSGDRRSAGRPAIQSALRCRLTRSTIAPSVRRGRAGPSAPTPSRSATAGSASRRVPRISTRLIESIPRSASRSRSSRSISSG